jgi:chaperonin GroES
MRGQCVWGEVISVGEGIFTQTGDKIPMTVEVGDRVMYKKDMGGDVIKLNDEEYLMFREHDLIMVIKNK